MIGNKFSLMAFLQDQDAKKVFELKEHKEKRSLNANSYYWTLLGKIARELTNGGTAISTAEIHNDFLREISTPVEIDGNVVTVSIPDTPQAERQAQKSETYHLKPTSATEVSADGTILRSYLMLRGSSTFNSQEMAALINLCVEEAQNLGIETLTKDEISHLKGISEEIPTKEVKEPKKARNGANIDKADGYTQERKSKQE